jgi:phospholipase/carboxylesterase
MQSAALPLYHVVRPAPPSEGRLSPLLILLHGVGSNEADLYGLTPYLDERFFVISARAPITLGPNAFAWYHVDLLPDRMIINAAEEKATRAQLVHFINEAVKAYPVDPKQVYLMGFSQGAIMSYGLMLTQPEKLAGVVAMSGRLLDEVRSEATEGDGLKDFPILIVHGLHDPVIPIKYAREAKEYLTKLPLRLTYYEYDMAHHVSQQSLDAIRAWLGDRLAENTRA